MATLEDIVEALEATSDSMTWYFDRETGRVGCVTDDDRECDIDDAPEWQRESIEFAQVVDEDTADRFVALPEEFDIDEWEMMRAFAATSKGELVDAISGTGAFRRFKDAVHRLGIADEWYAFRDAALRRLALEWCEENGIEVEGD